MWEGLALTVAAFIECLAALLLDSKVSLAALVLMFCIFWGLARNGGVGADVSSQAAGKFYCLQLGSTQCALAISWGKLFEDNL